MPGTATPAARPALALALSLLLFSCASTQVPDLAQEFYDIGNAWLEMGKWDKAGSAYEKALFYDRTLVAASYNLARALIEAGSYPKALEILNELLSEDGDNVRLITLRAYALYRSGDDLAALDAYRRASELNPYDAATLRNLSLLLERAGRDEEALALLRELYAVDPSNDTILRRLALLEAKEADSESAEELLTAYLARKGDDLEVLRRRATLREGRELFALALEDWTALVKAQDADADAWFHVARIRLVVAGDGAGGLEALRKALDAKYSDAESAAALLAALPEAERAPVAELLKAAGLVE